MLYVATYVYRIIRGKYQHSFSKFRKIKSKLINFFKSRRAREALRQCLPDQLRDSTFSTCLQEDKSTKHWLTLLIKNLEPGSLAQDPRQVGISPLAS